MRFGPFEVEAIAVKHPVEAFALRVSADGAVLAYSGDTGVCAGLDRAASGADLFLGEASFQEGADNPPDLHLTGRECGEVATRAGVRRLVLTHVPPWHDPQVALNEAKQTYAGPSQLALAGDVYEITAD
ncbi:MBL fold metallo-hydrolase [Nocardioides houyundeii]|uniref:MBL fold metallo-hydrolase n=1 Tax=Nocardioides houyundeii TaxID=2045452 RepID=UPI002411431E|nr:MBL fold metallo-hydrolase [Nocardioides houyundeii]